MSRRRLTYYQILDVLHQGPNRNGDPVAYYLRAALPSASVIEANAIHAPGGTFIPTATGVILPRKKKGEKFVVRYTTTNEKEF